MADYWKSMDKKYCDFCKCWITDNKATVAFHENGNRHKQNVQNRLKEIHKKNKSEASSERKLKNEMKKIEQAANAAVAKDREDNPDVSMKIQSYYAMLKDAGGDAGPSDATVKKPSQPAILHRNEKQKKIDDATIANLHKPSKSYHKFGGWETPKDGAIGSKYLELPTKSQKTPGAMLHSALSSTIHEDVPTSFAEKKVETLSSSRSSSIKEEQTEVAFKKRKLTKSNMRQRQDEHQ